VADSSYLGMEPDAVDEFARALRFSAARLDAVAADIGAALSLSALDDAFSTPQVVSGLSERMDRLATLIQQRSNDFAAFRIATPRAPSLLAKGLLPAGDKSVGASAGPSVFAKPPNTGFATPNPGVRIKISPRPGPGPGVIADPRPEPTDGVKVTPRPRPFDPNAYKHPTPTSHPQVRNATNSVVDDILPKPNVTDPKLQNYVDNLYKGTTNPGRVGTGTSADAVRNEILTGQPTGGTFHSIKVQETVNGLTRWLRNNPGASASDRLVAQSLLDDLKSALATKKP
jgi:hypothetical protein